MYEKQFQIGMTIKKIKITEQQFNRLKNYMKQEKEEVTYYLFQSELKAFLRDLLEHPVQCKLNPFFTEKGFTKGKVIEYLLKAGMLEREEKVNDEDPEHVTLDTSYLVPKKNFERKMKVMFIKLFES
jgi:hypothetical protein